MFGIYCDNYTALVDEQIASHSYGDVERVYKNKSNILACFSSPFLIYNDKEDPVAHYRHFPLEKL